MYLKWFQEEESIKSLCMVTTLGTELYQRYFKWEMISTSLYVNLEKELNIYARRYVPNIIIFVLIKQSVALKDFSFINNKIAWELVYQRKE